MKSLEYEMIENVVKAIHGERRLGEKNPNFVGGNC
jgi:hypothetical protein